MHPSLSAPFLKLLASIPAASASSAIELASLQNRFSPQSGSCLSHGFLIVSNAYLSGDERDLQRNQVRDDALVDPSKVSLMARKENS
jgi:hypothetical protein